MKIDLPVGTRATLEEFIDAYTPYFLMKYGYREYSTPVPLSGRRVIYCSVKTKHGEIIVHDDDVLTYVGGKKWAVEQRKEHRGEDWLLYLFKERQYVPKGVEVLNEDKQHPNFAKLQDLINEYWDTADGFQKILKRKNSSTTVPHVTLSKENQKIPNDLWQRTKSDDLMWDLEMKAYKAIDDWLTKSTFDYADKKLREDLEPFLDWLNSSHIKYSLRWYEPKPWDQVGPQFNIYLLNDEEKPAAVLESYWDGKEVVGAMVHGSDVFDRQRLDAVKDRLMLYLPTYHYRFDERIF